MTLELREPWWRRWVVTPVMAQLKQGTSPRQAALAVAVGFTVGLFPLLGTPTLMTLAIGIPLKVNQVIAQIFKEIAYPLHLIAILPFLKAGAWLFGLPAVTLSLTTLKDRFLASPGAFFRDFGLLGLSGVGVWCLVAPVVGGLCYCIAHAVLKGWAHRSQRTHS
jgi:uncharacterized protein (DUF2062 family)